jgi:hypothetical protein
VSVDSAGILETGPKMAMWEPPIHPRLIRSFVFSLCVPQHHLAFYCFVGFLSVVVYSPLSLSSPPSSAIRKLSLLTTRSLCEYSSIPQL